MTRTRRGREERAGSRVERLRGLVTKQRTAVAAAMIAALSMVLSTGGIAAYFSDFASASASGRSGTLGVSVTDMTLGGEGAGSGLVLAHGRAYELAFTVSNDGTAPWRGEVSLLNYFAQGGDDLGERGIVLVWPGDADPADIEAAVAAGDHSGATVIGNTTDDTLEMPGAEPPTTGQRADLGEIRLGAGESRSFAFQVVVRSDALVTSDTTGGEVVGGYLVSPRGLYLAAVAEATGVNGGHATGWSGADRGDADAVARIRVNTPPVIEPTTANTRPFVGQVGTDPTADDYLRALVRVTDAEDDPDGDGAELRSALTWTTDFDPDVVGPWSATYDVTDTGGAAAEPVTVSGETWTFTEIENGQYHTLALDSLGRVWGWGYGASGRVGVGGTSNVRVPTLLPAFDGSGPATTVVDIAAAYDSSYAVTADGKVWAWGYNASGLGNGSTSSQTPVAFSLPEPAAQISGNQYTVGAVTTTGNVYAWGYNASGQVGDGTTTTRATPVKVDVHGIVQLSMGFNLGAAVDGNGDLFTWGSDSYGLLGDGPDSHGDTRNPPTRVTPAGTAVTMVAVGQLHALAITTGGDVYGWGYAGEYRIGATGNADVPRLIDLDFGAAAYVHAGYDQSWVTMASGRLVSFGHNSYGDLMRGDPGTNKTPGQATDPNLTGLVMVVGTYDNAFALRSDGHVYGVGYSGTYQLGTGSTADVTSRNVRWGFTPPAVP